MLDTLALDGVWMDYLHWHAQFEDPYPVFIKTCFCDGCLSAFQSATDIDVQGNDVPEKSKWIFMNAVRAWEDWRVSVICDWGSEFKEHVKGRRPEGRVGAFHCAWKDEDLGGVRGRCLGLDFQVLSPYVDIFSPMVYHGRSGKRPEYVEKFVSYFGDRYVHDDRPDVWPIVKAHDEFEQVLHYGMSVRSTGVTMFTIKSVAEDPGKVAAMRRVYSG
ncbi:TPA: hypothetical protein DCE37_15985 [Candidatus Latescibacteria bacterium]|nr:hypothetical protein [Candidatus Latescibacterota bacterium]